MTDHSIGAILADGRRRSADLPERPVRHHRHRGGHFGEAAVGMDFTSRVNPTFVPVRPINYPCMPERSRKPGDELVTLHDPFGQRAEHFRALRSQRMMQVDPEGNSRRALAVISPDAVVPSLFVLPLGTTPPNPSELVERPVFALLMRELAAKFDQLVVDTPAATCGPDAAVIAARCGSALVVTRQNRRRVGHLQELLASFTGSPARLAGVVANEF